MKKTLTYGLLGLALGAHLLMGTSLYLTYAQAEGDDDVYKQLELFTSVLERVRNDYVEGESLTYQELIRGALRGMLSGLDPHSEFLDEAKYDDLKRETEGVFGGVGLVISTRDDALVVVAPMEDTPAARADIKSGDRIIRIEGVSTDQLTLSDSVRRLRGEPGTVVRLTLLRPSSGQVYEVSLTRAIIKVETVKDLTGGGEFKLGTDGIGYVRVTQFGERTTDGLTKALKALEQQGMRSLVLDLRDNPGGLLDEAVEVCRLFLPAKQLVVSTEGRWARDRAEYWTRSRGAFSGLRVVVLVNMGSASASEIVAGCLKDSGRAVVVGERTFGKGSVQKILPLKGGTAVRLTTAKYYTPSRRPIHEHGIDPDVEVRNPESADLAALGAEADAQLATAFDILKGVEFFAKGSGLARAQASRPADKMARAR